MNIYGDRGNVIALRRRAEWRGIPVEVREIGIGEPIPADVDLLFLGRRPGPGASRRRPRPARTRRARRCAPRSKTARPCSPSAAATSSSVTSTGRTPPNRLPGIGLFDAVSVAGPERFIGNVVVESQWGELVGFENHSGLTTLGPGVEPMGRVRVGRGNNGRDGTEGAIYRNAVGCYLHGSLLPKNPVLADWLIARALERRYGPVALPPISDTFEHSAHASAVQRAMQTR